MEGQCPAIADLAGSRRLPLLLRRVSPGLPPAGVVPRSPGIANNVEKSTAKRAAALLLSSVALTAGGGPQVGVRTGILLRRVFRLFV